MILVNLLPHRQRRRQERRRSFYVGLVASAALGLALVLAVQQGLDGLVRAQSARNATLDAGIARLDTQLRDIAALRRDIAGLLARQQAVQTLQRDRNQPVHLLQELVDRTPQTVQLRSLRQTGTEVALTGWAQTHEAVSQMLRSLTAAESRFVRAELLEIRAVTPAQPAGGVTEGRRVFEFSMRVVQRASDVATGEPGAGRASSGT
jgi:type IV pilus assembly protein PilN